MRRNLATRSFWAIVCCLADLLPSPVFAAGGEEPGLISLDWSLLIQGVNFLLLLVLLTKILYRPLLAKMNERTHAIQKSLDEAQQARAEAQKERDEFAAKIQAAYAEAQGIRAAALKDAADEQRRLVDAARAEAARLVASARQEMDQDVRRARQELRQEVADLAIAIAERLIKKSLNDADHRRVVDDAIARMGQKN
jgi:F-type H+-transporting ATPase subunit b